MSARLFPLRSPQFPLRPPRFVFLRVVVLTSFDRVDRPRDMRKANRAAAGGGV
jgi:hypothetical protein